MAVLCAALLFGTAGTAQALLAPDAWPPSVAAVRLGIGALGLLCYAMLTSASSGVLALLRQPLVWLMALAVAGYQVFFFAGVQATGVAVGTLIALGSAPLLAGALAWAVGQGRPGGVWAASTSVALFGLAILTGGGAARPVGIAAALAAGASYAVYTVLGARLALRGHRPTAVIAAPFALAALFLLPFWGRADWLLSGRGAVLAIWLGLAATTLAYLLFASGLPLLQPARIATLTLLEPVAAALLAVVLLSEHLSWSGWLGCALILVSVGALASDRRALPMARR